MCPVSRNRSRRFGTTRLRLFMLSDQIESEIRNTFALTSSNGLF
jgi:hypothetical protein